MLSRLTVMTLLLGVLAAPAQGSPLGALFQRVSPAVGVIKTVKKEIVPQKDTPYKNVYGLGSGVLISDDGKLLTAAHVVHTADAVAVEFVNGETIPAKVIGSLPSADIALLELEKPPEGIVPVPLADSDTVQPGDEVMVIGAPYGLSHTLSAGHVSGRHTTKDVISEFADVEILQSDAAVNRGNSGGPMFNMQGEVVGIVSHILTQSGGFEGISFAVAINVAKRTLLEHPVQWSGVDGVLMRGPLARVFNIPQNAGYLVQRVAEGSGGAKLGLKMGYMKISIEGQELIVGGDILLSLDGLPIEEDPQSLVKIIQRVQEKTTGDRITAKVLRAGQVIKLERIVD
ncbi:MAG: trypsin-like peptidase domain-containing protein [Deltaproteobacteria bacterium]|jgi:S1-C subfamily serine protease|nr:trypsin-like peptidase domain-containing protein [Deltaproteobacteria bacterium]